MDFWVGWECTLEEVTIGGGGKGVTEWERVSRETIVMYDITPRWLPFKHLIG